MNSQASNISPEILFAIVFMAVAPMLAWVVIHFIAKAQRWDTQEEFEPDPQHSTITLEPTDCPQCGQSHTRGSFFCSPECQRDFLFPSQSETNNTGTSMASPADKAHHPGETPQRPCEGKHFNQAPMTKDQ